jgi:apolipoprotein N-acyltransferase
LAFFSGLVTPFAFSPYFLFPLAFVSIAIIIYIWTLSTPRLAGIYGYIFGLGFFGSGVSWLHISINIFGGVNLIGSYLLTFLLIAFLALFPALCGYLSSRLYIHRWPAISIIIGIPAYWTLSEWIRSWIFTGFPWLNLGYSQSDSILNGLAPLLGVFGVCLSVVLICACLTGLFIVDKNKRYICLLTAILIWGASWIGGELEWSKPLDQSLSVALIQGAVPQEIKWNPAMRQPTLDLYRELTLSNLDNDLIIWPEAAIPAYYHQMQDYINGLSRLAINNDFKLLTGIPVWDENTENFYNSIVLIGNDLDFYYKKHLVPFGEYLPLKFLLGGIVKILNIPMAYFSSGPDKAPLIDTGNYKIGISICYEDIFGNEVIQALPDAALLVNVSNDAWFGDSVAPHQHMQMARMRAMETGRYMLRATNTGVTAIIDEKGRILSSSPQFIPASLTGEVKLFTGHTPYSRLGNYPVIIYCLAVLGIMVYIANSSKRINTQNRI